MFYYWFNELVSMTDDDKVMNDQTFDIFVITPFSIAKLYYIWYY